MPSRISLSIRERVSLEIRVKQSGDYGICSSKLWFVMLCCLYINGAEYVENPSQISNNLLTQRESSTLSMLRLPSCLLMLNGSKFQ